MNKDFVPYEPSLALKELGFDETCFGSYVKLTETQTTFFMNDVVSKIDRETPLHESLITKTPTFSQAFRFFREKYNLSFSISQRKTSGLSYWEIVFIDKFENAMHGIPSFHSETKISGISSTYQEGEIDGLKKLIELIKN